MFPTQLGLKASCDPEQMESRLKYHPDVFEFFTSGTDFTTSGLQHLREVVQTVKASGAEAIVLHHPVKYQGQFLELMTHSKNKTDLVDFINYSTQELLKIARDSDCKVLAHGSYKLREKDLLEPFENIEEAQNYLFTRVDEFCELGENHTIFENGTSKLFSFGKPEFGQLLAQKGYPLAYDISHAFIYLHGDDKALQCSLETSKKTIIHYHLVDSLGETHDSLTLGHEKINWAEALLLLNENATSVYEINLKDLNNSIEQLKSHAYLTKVTQAINSK